MTEPIQIHAAPPAVATPDATEAREFAAPLAGAAAGHLLLTGGVARLTLQATTDMPDLIRARFERPVPRLRADAGTVTIHYPRPPLLA
jgi:hypothetical protein